ncbi:hypothetical protein HUG15_12345 [Salicibibacter cibarius]|uniref:Tripartite tricarboxylate transporter substrate binding protein n=1 Tax=Salicibibacter cibarius TaxID=2743000 RepID=A0A7T6Z3L3_9BACI|nr:hypothetical protein [Salicibibacter cibarius]QQK76269.1 hypothetical protein HUG15_12345 [Salicibibacter cibarius]
MSLIEGAEIMKSKKYCILLTSILMVFATGCGSGSEGSTEDSSASTDEEADEFYESGDVIELVIPFSTGGGSDTANRYMAPFIEEYTEGSPSIQPVNIPGGSSMTGSNDFAMREPDGYSLLGANPAVVIQDLIGRPEAEYDVTDMDVIMSVPGVSVVAISTATGYEEPEDLLAFGDEDIPYGLADPIADLRHILAFELLDIADKMDFVSGYDGGGATLMALEQGELGLTLQGNNTYFNDMMPMVEEGTIIPLFQTGILNEEGDFERDPEVDLPTIQEFYEELHGEEPSGELWEAYKLFQGSLGQMSRRVYIPNDAPEEATRALKDAAEDVAEDPEFLEGAEDALGTTNVLVGEELEAAYEREQEYIDPETIDFVKNLLIEEYDVEGLN